MVEYGKNPYYDVPNPHITLGKIKINNINEEELLNKLN